MVCIYAYSKRCLVELLSGILILMRNLKEGKESYEDNQLFDI